ncbi:MAG: glycosyltransferase [Planctomycetota bacterium]|jgi:glycosyltransferase involved in cell wall biosynthesis
MTPRRSYDCIIPVHNDCKRLETNILRLHEFLSASLAQYDWCIVIADNASTDSTPEAGRRFAETLERVVYFRMEQKGRGRALRRTWMHSNADFVSYMDVDLSTNLKAVPEMMDLFEKGSEVILGSRLIAGANITRCRHREIISRGWNFLVGAVFNTRFSDAQCGFKGLARAAKEVLVSQTEDPKWFFDTELLVLAEKQGFRMHEIAVEWVEDVSSTVQLARTIIDDVAAMVRLKSEMMNGRKLTRPDAVASGEGFLRDRRGPGA